MRCDGNHAAPACADRHCWRGEPMCALWTGNGHCTLPEHHRPPCLPYSTPTTLVPVVEGETLSGAPTIVVPDGTQVLTVGPDEVLVVAFSKPLDNDTLHAFQRELERTIPNDRFVIVSGGGAQLSKVHSPQRRMVESGVLRSPLSQA